MDSVFGWAFLLLLVIFGAMYSVKYVLAEYEEYLHRRETGWGVQ